MTQYTNPTDSRVGLPPRGHDRVSTFTAARLLFPDQPITRAQLRLVQRLCQSCALEAYKIGRKYYIVRQSIADYLDENHYRNAKATR